MIISRLEGGLGNQMFQYAYGLYAARRNATQLWLDLRSYACKPQHGFLLDRFQIEAAALPGDWEYRIPRRYRSQKSTVWDRIADGMLWGNLRRLKQPGFGFYPKCLSVPNNRYLVGYWQSEKFFPGMRQELLRQFALREAPSEQSLRVAARIQACNSVALHVRRGDYLSSQASGIYAIQELDYYRSCLSHWAEGKSNVQVFVFSNDMSWCQEKLDLPWPTHWVEHNSALTAHEDMWLMSQAACCIIANSTFSWWAAWLNQRPEKAVYAPPNWFMDKSLDEEHLVPPDWIREIPRSLRSAA